MTNVKTTATTKKKAKRTTKRRKKSKVNSGMESAPTIEAESATAGDAHQVDISTIAGPGAAPAKGKKSAKRAPRRRSRTRAASTADKKTDDADVATDGAVEKETTEGTKKTRRTAKKARRGRRGERSREAASAEPAGTEAEQVVTTDTADTDTSVPDASPATVVDTPSRAAPETDKAAGEPRRTRGRARAGRGKASQAEAGTKARREKPVVDAAKGKKSTTSSSKSGGREMLINVSAGDECRIAVLAEGQLEELFIERSSSQSHVGNIYKGRITNIEPSIQAAFVDFGLPQKNGFLHISDVQPQYFPDHTGEAEEVGRKIPRHHRPPIQKCFRRGQEVIVQVTKEGVGTKGPTLTTYLSIPGRFLVMMPGMNRHGVSRKIEDEAERRSMRELLSELDLPSGIGFILRTAGLGRTKRELQRDLNYLIRLWKTVAERIKRLPTPSELYQESDLVTRTIRDVYTADFSRVIVDDAATAKKAREFLRIAMPRSRADVELYSAREPLFHRYGIEAEIERINMRQVPLPSGGSLVIESTEALVAIDVNSGRSRINDDAEETAFQINLEAAEEIARQLRLRDLGGLIICDFIDMRLDRHKRAVERAIRDALKKHKERARTLKMSAFGLIEMTRQRQGPSLKRNIYFDCPHCKGSGQVKMPDSVILDVMRIIQLAAHHDDVSQITVTVASDVAYQILNSKRTILSQIETETEKQIVVRGEESFTTDQVECHCEDSRGRPVEVIPPPVRKAGDGPRKRRA